MKSLQTILFPTDFSACAEKAYAHAWYLAAEYDAELHVLSIAHTEEEVDSSPLQFLPAGQHELAKQLGLDRESRFAREHADSRPNVVTAQVKGFSTWRTILDYASEHDADLIVMGTHGRHGIDRILMGSVAEQIVRRAECPVLTVREEHTAGPTPGHHQIVVVPIDFSEFSRTSIRYALALARLYEAEVHLLHVIQQVTLPNVYGIDPVPVVVPDIQERTEEALRELGDELIGDSVPFSPVVAVGHAGHEIVQYAAENDADMVVIATHGLAGFKRLLMGSVTEHVVRDSPCPVFAVRSFGKSLVDSGSNDSSKKEEHQ